MIKESYEEFVEKFKPKKTTDDCYTPDKVYKGILNWVINEYNLKDFELARPFYPGRDYKNFDYKPNTIVIDNPPFSILSEIKNFYNENNIKYFLFAPQLTLFSSNNTGESYIVINSNIIYENGARVKTAFITNLEESFIRISPSLTKVIKDTNTNKTFVKYRYPNNLITSANLCKFVKDKELKINKKDCYHIRRLDSQKEDKKQIYGAGFLVSDKVVDDLKDIEESYFNIQEFDKDYPLSEREKDIIRKLNEG